MECFRRSCDLNCLNLDYVDKYFRDLLKDGTRELTREEFKKMIPCKNVLNYLLKL